MHECTRKFRSVRLQGVAIEYSDSVRTSARENLDLVGLWGMATENLDLASVRVRAEIVCASRIPPRHLAAGTRRLGGSETLRLCHLTLGNFLQLLDGVLTDF